MFKTLLLLFPVCMLSCGQAVQQEVTAPVPVSDNPAIYGDWGLCAERHGDGMIQYNTCATLRFDRNGSGQYIREGKGVEDFLWRLEGGRVRISVLRPRPDQFFTDSSYVVQLQAAAVHWTMELGPPADCYLLTRAQ